MEQIIRKRITELESECKKYGRKIAEQNTINMKTIEYLVEIQKNKESINNLYDVLRKARV